MCEEVQSNITFLSPLSVNISCPEATEREVSTLLLLSFFLEGVAQFTFSSLGVLGNTISIFVLTRKALSNFFNKLLVVLSMYDLVYCATMMLQSLTKLGLDSHIQTLLFPHFLYPLGYISMTGSIYMTMIAGIERYIAVHQPTRRVPSQFFTAASASCSHTQRLLKYVVPVTLLSLIFNIPKFLESKLVYEHKEVYIEVTELRISTWYVTWYHNWARFIMLGALPFASISFINYKIYTVVNTQRRRSLNRMVQEDSLSGVLMMIIVTFLSCNILRLVLNMHEIYVVKEMNLCRCSDLGGFPVWILILGFVSPVLLALNSSINLVIYCVFGTKFRKVLSSYLH